VGPGCEVLARRGADPVLVRHGNILAACFHPELAEAHPVVAMFAAMVRARR
jgi:5'-phosphate synthase pdxT subunit